MWGEGDGRSNGLVGMRTWGDGRSDLSFWGRWG